MDTLPVELLQVINNYLEFIDQIKFKSSCKWHYEKVLIKQVIPYILIRVDFFHEHQCDGSRHSTIYVEDCVKLNKFYLKLPEYTEKWTVWHDALNICVMSPNKYNKIPCKRSLFDDTNICDYEAKIHFEHEKSAQGEQDAKIRYDLTDIEIDYYCDSKELYLDGEPFNIKTFVMKCLKIFNDNELI